MKRLKHIVLSLTLFLMIAGYTASSQELYEYSVNESTGSYSSISGTLLTTGDDSYTSFTMPFSFIYDNTSITSLGVNTNGYIKFNGTASGIPSTINSYPSSILLYSHDMFTNGQVEYAVAGTAPNRILTVQWSNMGTYSTTCRNDYRDVQVKFYETSNTVEIVLGPGWDTYSGNCLNGTLAFSGFGSGEYINIQPGSPSTFHKGINGSIDYVDASARPYLPAGKSYKLTTYPSLISATPGQDSIFRRGDIITGQNHPSVTLENVSDSYTILVNYKIAGPLPRTNPNYKVIYTATQEGNQNNEDVRITRDGETLFTEAKGDAARTNPSNDGALSLGTNIKAGTYEVLADMRLQGINFSMSLPAQTFVIALDNDLSIFKSDSPVDKTRRKYPFSQGQIPVNATFVSQGVNPIDEFTATATIYNSAGAKVWENTLHWKDQLNPLVINSKLNLSFGTFRPNQVGDYTIVFTSDLVNALDQDLSNNRLPREGVTTFEVAYEFEAAAVGIVDPKDEVYVGRPIVPKGTFQNVGVGDISDVPARFTITRLSDNQVVYFDEIIIVDIQQGKYAFTTAAFSNVYIPDQPGTYQACVEIDMEEDLVKSNNIYCENFEVVHSIAGTYTIGTRFAGGARNFNTIQEAVNELYIKGISGPVRFELTDANYEVGTYTLDKAALDLRGKIIGASATNTITFVPANNMTGVKAGIKINLNTAKGVGIMFGQTYAPDNPYATVNFVLPNLVREYGVSEGYFVFDGGISKAFNFRLHSPSAFRSVFYLGDGAKNITIKNSVINNYSQTEEQFKCDLPNSIYRTGVGFTFETDLRNTGATYSSGIIMRSVPPIFEKEGRNSYNLDTLATTNNVITGNEISGFAYGVVSLGMGPLYDTRVSKYMPYYNRNNEIKGNVIKDVARAGIYLGFESNTKIENNVIFNILGGCSGVVAGIMAGGERDGLNMGYNNMNLFINANEISNVSSDGASIGIKIEQERHQFFENQKTVYFPLGSAKNTITNNVVRNIVTRAPEADRYGVIVTTARKTPATAITGEAQFTDYFTSSEVIANNTVVISNDSYVNTGSTVGMLIQNASSVKFMNNAIAVLENSVAPNALTTLVAYTGVNPLSESGVGLLSDRNAYWYTGAATTQIRFIDLENTGATLELGTIDSYKNLSQWRAWTNQDRNSVFGDFVKDLVVVGYNPGKLRVNLNPAPLGSILNNRGERLTEVPYDIDGEYRGEADRRYDIGSDEFDGRLNVADLEVVDINAPESYRSSTGMFNDAEYIMTTAPVEVTATIRNNGSLIKQGAAITVKIYQQNADGSFATAPTVEERILSNFLPAANLPINFLLANKTGKEFNPLTYADLRNAVPKYIVPAQFGAMEANVTPVYKIVVTTEDDENAANNQMIKYVRFYLKKSSIDILITGEYLNANLNTPAVTPDMVAGKLNSDSLRYALKYLGWKIDIDNSIFDYDLFDRNGWEPRAINYNDYRTLLYSDGLNDGLSHQVKLDLEDYLEQGENGAKRNLVIASEEFIRNSSEPAFATEYLAAENQVPGNPMGAGVSNAGNQVKGVAIARDFRFPIINTNFSNAYVADVEPMSGLLKLIPVGDGVRRTGFVYVNHPASGTNDVAAVAVTTLSYNAATIATDWRHFGNIELLARGIVDFIENNGGHIVPVEMYTFDAKAKGASVVLDWSTASENNVNRFEVEKAEVNAAGITDFTKIEETKANGTGAITYYGPVVDNNVKMGATYAYRLRIVDNDGAWSFSDTREVTLSGANGAISVEEVKPNPVVNSGSFSVNLTEAMNVSIEVYDMSSAKVMTLANGTLNAGLTTFNLNASELSNGAYTVVVRSGDVTLMKKFTIVK